jgi:hypothetical protein
MRKLFAVAIIALALTGCGDSAPPCPGCPTPTPTPEPAEICHLVLWYFQPIIVGKIVVQSPVYRTQCDPNPLYTPEAQ